MSSANNFAYSISFVRAIALAVVFFSISACTTSRISPQYVPQGLLTDWKTFDPTIEIATVDRIQNLAPVPTDSSSFLGIRRNVLGNQMICEHCSYQLDLSPTDLVKQFLNSALQRNVATLAVHRTKKLEVQVLQFEFFAPKENAGFDFHMEGRVRLRAIVMDNSVVVADRAYLESRDFSSGSTVLGEEIEEWVSTTVSSAVEHVLSDAQISEGLQKP